MTHEADDKDSAHLGGYRNYGCGGEEGEGRERRVDSTHAYIHFKRNTMVFFHKLSLSKISSMYFSFQVLLRAV